MNKLRKKCTPLCKEFIREVHALVDKPSFRKAVVAAVHSRKQAVHLCACMCMMAKLEHEIGNDPNAFMRSASMVHFQHCHLIAKKKLTP